jgi:aminoglycoside phosphotransferase (APT) family kinase protein
MALKRLAYENPETARKRGQAFRLRREAEAMKYVQSHTSIPIPVILDMCLATDGDEEESWILMERLPGQQLTQAWPAVVVLVRGVVRIIRLAVCYVKVVCSS